MKKKQQQQQKTGGYSLLIWVFKWAKNKTKERVQILKKDKKKKIKKILIN